jgi:hypothetical protein
MQHVVATVTTTGQLLDEVWAFVRSAGVAAERNVMLYADDVPNVEVGLSATRSSAS